MELRKGGYRYRHAMELPPRMENRMPLLNTRAV